MARISETLIHQNTELGIAHDIAQFDAVVRVIGGIPERSVMERASRCLAPTLATRTTSTAYLIGSTKTISPSGEAMTSIPEQGIILQESIKASPTLSRVYGTLPWNPQKIEDNKLLLRQASHNRHATYMHPDLEGGVLFNEGEKYEWNNEALGVARLAS